MSIMRVFRAQVDKDYRLGFQEALEQITTASLDKVFRKLFIVLVKRRIR